MGSESLLLRLTAILVLGVSAQWLAWRLRFPSILLLLLVGLAAGPGLEFLSIDPMLGELLAPLVSLAVAVILFEGGLTLDWGELARVGRSLGQLILVGMALTWALATLLAHRLLGLPWEIALLLGSILTVTGPTVVGPLLRHVRPKGAVEALANGESIVVDVLGASVAVLVFHALDSGGWGQGSALSTVTGLAKTLAAGALVGSLAATCLILALRRHWIPDGLQSPIVLALVLGSYTLADRWQSESGLLAVTLIGFALRNQRRVPIARIVAFKENLRTLLLACLFVVLAARVELADLRAFGAGEALFVALLILVVRPLAVGLGTLGTPVTTRERLFLAFLAPRGVVAAAMSALFGARLELEGAHHLAPLTFLVIIVTVSFYGLVAPLLARRLGLSDPDPQGILSIGAGPLARAIAQVLGREGVAAVLVDSNRDHIAEARLAGLTAVHANALDEEAAQHLPLGGVGRVLALTPNDEVNSLAVLHYSELFGRRNAYQLAPRSGAGVSTELRGRFLFGQGRGYAELARLLARGFQIRATTLSETFDLASWRAHHGPLALPLMRIDPGGGLTVFTDESEPEAGPGERLIALVPAPPEESEENGAAPKGKGREPH